jgi:hypothetical protein
LCKKLNPTKNSLICKPVQALIFQALTFQALSKKLNFGTLFNPDPVLRFPKRYATPPVGQNIREETDFLENRLLLPRAVPWRLADLRPLPKNYLFGVGLVLEISSSSFHSIKVIQLFLITDTQTDTHTLSSIDKQANFLCLFDTYHCKMFMKDNNF